MSDSIDLQMKSLQIAIEERVPYCSGTVSVPPEGLIVYYGRDSDAHRLDFANVAELGLFHLSNTCDPATFGRNQENVLDESYRKAGKLDSAHFCVKLDLERTGLMKEIRDTLLQGPQSESPVYAELYKLNVYGEGSFFKSHKDTPRGEAMFGSLVIIFPTIHQGGGLIFRDNGKEWKFDSAAAINDRVGPSIAYAAFFSDTEHEVLEVTSGYRVTVTYNLYFQSSEVSKIPPVCRDDISSFKAIFQSLLNEPTFVPNGGKLAFGLHHKYPFDTEQKGALQGVIQYLKGSDAILYNACKELSLQVQANLVYEYNKTWCVLLKKIPNIRWFVEYNESLTARLTSSKIGGKWTRTANACRGILWEKTYMDSERDHEDEDRWLGRSLSNTEVVHWVTETTDLTKMKGEYAAYGNEASVQYVYAAVCLVVRVGVFGEREVLEDDLSAAGSESESEEEED